MLRYDTNSSVALSEHFGIDPVDEAEVASHWSEVPQRCATGERPIALFHWKVRAFPSSLKLDSFLDEQDSVERVNEWMSTLDVAMEVNVSAFMTYPLTTHQSIVPLPLALSREQLGGFTEAPGIWLVKREGDAPAGPTIYEVNLSRQDDSLGLRVAFLSLARGTRETIQSLLDAAEQVASFAVVPFSGAVDSQLIVR